VSVVEKGTWVKVRMDGRVVAMFREGEPAPVELTTYGDEEAIYVNGHRLAAGTRTNCLKVSPLVEVEVLVDPMSDVLWAKP